jgi:hypothetical protein
MIKNVIVMQFLIVIGGGGHVSFILRITGVSEEER